MGVWGFEVWGWAVGVRGGGGGGVGGVGGWGGVIPLLSGVYSEFVGGWELPGRCASTVFGSRGVWVKGFKGLGLRRLEVPFLGLGVSRLLGFRVKGV